METLMFDYLHFYDRIAKELPSGCNIAEIGVADGHSALYLAERLHHHNKTFKLYMVDSMDYGQYEQMKTIYTNIIKSGLGEFIEVIPYESLEAVKKFNDGYLDFIYIDSSHTYEGTKEEIPAWYAKLKDGCILSGHDWNAKEVKQAVEEIVPKTFLRTDIPNRDFDVEQVLHSEETTKGWGVWWFRKEWYLKLNK